MRSVSLHRVAGLALAAPLLLWMGTGLLFHVKYRYDEAYEALAAPAPEGLDWARARVAPAQVGAGPGARVHLFVHPLVGPAYLVLEEGRAPRAVSAVDGRAVEGADWVTARGWVLGAVRRGQHTARYGTLAAGEPAPATLASRFEGAPLEAWAFTFDGGKTVTVARLTGEVQQTGVLNAFIDLTYDVHYLRWTPWRPVNLALLVVAVPAMVALALSGVWLFARRRRR